MGIEAAQKTIENYINTLLEDSKDVFLVDVKVNSGNNIIVFLDADSGITIEKCIHINRALYRQIEEDGLFPNGDFSIEVSSPGVDEPLRLLRQYKVNIGRKVEVLLKDESKKEGKLLTVNDDEIIIEQTDGKGKKAIKKNTPVLFDQIRHTKVLVTF